MKIAPAAMVVVILSLLALSCNAESTDYFQSVGGDYARNWLNALNAQNPQNSQAAENSQINQNTQTTQGGSDKKESSEDLWSWGNAPKGSRIIGGQLVADPIYRWPGLNYTYGWLGDSDVNPYAERPLYTYTDPETGETNYGYWDPTTGKMIPVSPDIWMPLFPDDQPYSSAGANSGSLSGAGIPSVFSTNDPWA
ncbi:MAG: hypothetical protein A4E48_00563 [Methanosaeta sp. PtaU1.Bin060]|jgi:hypothetical protein|nr:MAG: hypothetical protein A4E48_00563 [Methanosaeta sp. PtaU1.Bin060]